MNLEPLFGFFIAAGVLFAIWWLLPDDWGDK